MRITPRRLHATLAALSLLVAICLSVVWVVGSAMSLPAWDVWKSEDHRWCVQPAGPSIWIDHAVISPKPSTLGYTVTVTQPLRIAIDDNSTGLSAVVTADPSLGSPWWFHQGTEAWAAQLSPRQISVGSAAYLGGRANLTVAIHFFQVPFWPIVLLFLAWPIVWRRRAARVRKRAEQGCCIHCGYDLRASAGYCPECGVKIQNIRKV